MTINEESLDRTIGQRDRLENQITNIAQTLGCDLDWSNLHDHGVCALEAIHALQAERDKYKTALKKIAGDVCPHLCSGVATRIAEEALET